MRRTRIAFFGLFFFLGLAVVRLVHLQVFQHELWAAQAQRIQQQIVIQALQRGRLFDRQGVLLAEDVPSVSIAVDNSQMTRPEKLQDLLSQYLGMPQVESQEKIYRRAYFTWLRRHVDLETAHQLQEAARAAQIQGLLFLTDFRRHYPQGDLASNVIGFTDLDNIGIEGAELQFDPQLRGQAARYLITSMGDRQRTEIQRKTLHRGTPGQDVYLTIDSRIQHLAETAITAGVQRYRAQGGFALVLNTRTAEIEAMAQDRRFDLNRFQWSSPAQRKNLAVTVPFEPGSAAKIFTMLAALEADPRLTERTFDGSASYRPPVVRKRGDEYITTYPRTFRNAEKISYGTVTPSRVIEDSINTAMIQIAFQVVGAQRLYEQLASLGLGQKTGIELPGEVTGTLRPPDPYHPTELGDLAIGQAFSVTGVQLVQAVNAIANGGLLLRPTLHLSAGSPAGAAGPSVRPDRMHQISHAASTALLTQMMVQAVERGTGTAAKIAGYAIAGKSGTAQKAIPGRGYVLGKYTSLFVGFLPADAPQYLILVVLDEVGTKAYYGGQTAAPIFREIAEGLLKLKGILPGAEK